MVKKVCGIHLCRNFWKIFRNEDFGVEIFLKKGQIIRTFRPSTLKLKIKKKKRRICYVYTEKSFDNTFNISCGGGAGVT